jgi:low affinity Fe/Cu permease
MRGRAASEPPLQHLRSNVACPYQFRIFRAERERPDEGRVMGHASFLRKETAMSQEQSGKGTTQTIARNSTKFVALQEWFGRFAHQASLITGKPAVFLTAAAVVVLWAATGPLFGYSDTWQLVINTGTTIVTFLMVFLIQNTQNRDTLAIQLKLAEIIFVMKDAENRFATIEDLSDEELQQMQDEFRSRADQVADSLNRRRSGKEKEKDKGK